VLLIAGKSVPNVLGALVMLRSRAKESLFDLDPIFVVDTVGCHRPDRLTGETLLPSHLYSRLM
jgi:hypothetical protein